MTQPIELCVPIYSAHSFAYFPVDGKMSLVDYLRAVLGRGSYQIDPDFEKRYPDLKQGIAVNIKITRKKSKGKLWDYHFIAHTLERANEMATVFMNEGE